MRFLRLKTFLVGGTLVSLLMGGIFVSCHSLTNNEASNIDNPFILSVTAFSEPCCQIQTSNYGPSVSQLTIPAPIKLAQNDVFRATSVTFQLPTARWNIIRASQSLYFDSHPEVSLYSYLNLSLSQGLLNPLIYDLKQASV